MAWLQTVQNGSGSIFTGDPNRLTEHMCSAVGVQRWKVDWLRHTYCSMHICAFMNPNLTAMHMHSKESPDIIYRPTSAASWYRMRRHSGSTIQILLYETQNTPRTDGIIDPGQLHADELGRRAQLAGLSRQKGAFCESAGMVLGFA